MTKTSKTEYGSVRYGLDGVGRAKLFQSGEYYVTVTEVLDKEHVDGRRNVYSVIHEPTRVTSGMVASLPLAVRAAAWFNKELGEALSDPLADDHQPMGGGPAGFGAF